MRNRNRQQQIRKQAQRIAQQQRRIQRQQRQIQRQRRANQQPRPAAPAPQQPGPAQPPPPPQPSTPPGGQVGPGQVSSQDVDNAPYRSEDSFRQEAALTRQQQERLAGVNQQRQALGIGYGLGEFGGDATTNPYSRAALLQRQYDRNQRTSLNSYAASGQLYAGSLSNARNFNRFNYDVGYDSMRKQYDAALARLQREEQDAYADFDTGYEAALRQSVNDGMEDERPEAWEADPFPSDAGGNAGGGGAGGGNAGGGGGNAGGGGAGGNRRPIVQASRQRLTAAQKRINQLRAKKRASTNAQQRKNLTQRIQKNQTVVQRNRQRVQNVQQGKPTNQGIKPRPKKKGGKK